MKRPYEKPRLVRIPTPEDTEKSLYVAYSASEATRERESALRRALDVLATLAKAKHEKRPDLHLVE